MPFLIILLLIIGGIFVIALPLMLLFGLIRMLLPLIIIVGIWLLVRPKNRMRRPQDWSSPQGPKHTGPRPPRKDVTDSAKESHHDDSSWDDF